MDPRDVKFDFQTGGDIPLEEFKKKAAQAEEFLHRLIGEKGLQQDLKGIDWTYTAFVNACANQVLAVTHLMKLYPDRTEDLRLILYSFITCESVVLSGILTSLCERDMKKRAEAEILELNRIMEVKD